MFKINGIVKVVKDEQVISEKFKKREFVLTDASSMYATRHYVPIDTR